MGRKFLKRVVIKLPPTKDNEINAFLSDFSKSCSVYRAKQKDSDTLWAMLGKGWKCIFYGFSWSVSIILNILTHVV